MAFLAPVVAWIGTNIGTIATVASVAGTAISAYSSYESGQEAEKAHKEAKRIAYAEAEAKKEKYAYEEELHRQKIRRIIGVQRTLYAKAGVDITEGSPFLTMLKTEEEGEKEAEMIRKMGAADIGQSWGEARLQSMYGKAAARAGTMGALSTFFTGLGKAGTYYYGTKKGVA